MDLRLHIGGERGDVVVGQEPQQMDRKREHLLGFGEILEPLLGSEALEPLFRSEALEPCMGVRSPRYCSMNSS